MKLLYQVTALVPCLLIFLTAFSQQPRYTFKKFVSGDDTVEFKRIYPATDGFERTYIPGHPEIWDVDDDSTTFIRGGADALFCIEGNLKKNQRQGIFTFYLIDSLDHSKRYKIWEQQYSNDKLNGQWKTYTLRGTLVNFQTFKDDSLNGISRDYWIDGKTVMSEREFFNGRKKFVAREFGKNGRLESEIPYENGVITGTGRKYYETGILKEVAQFKDGKFDGDRKYYYPNGQLWIEQVYKAGKSWKVIANYTEKGQRRDAGTLNDGNGTIIFYNEDGTVRETETYVDGEARNNQDK